VADGATIDPRARLGRRVVVGSGATVAAGARVEDSVLHRGARVEAEATVTGSILGSGARVEAGALVEASVLAEAAWVPAGARVSGARASAGQEAGSADLHGSGQPFG
jgi:mannose-1-phosphate guanylyltransferase